MGRKSEFSTRSIKLLILANAGFYSEKKLFYRIKDQILERFGIPDGYDLQIIEHYCYACDGLGCFRCDKGVWDRKKWYLLRYKLGSHVFHQPVRTLPPGYDIRNDLREIVKGKIRHNFVDPREAQRAALCLIRKYDTKLWFKIHKTRLGKAFYPLRTRIVWGWRQLWNRKFYRDLPF